MQIRIDGGRALIDGRLETTNGRCTAFSRNPNDEPGERIKPRIEHKDACEFEDGAERRERQHALRITKSRTHPVCGTRKRFEKQHRQNADNQAEGDVRQRGTPHYQAAADHRQRGGRRRADALPHDHRAALLKRQRSRIQGNQCRRGGSARTLHDDCHDDPDAGENPHGAEAHACQRLEIPRDVGHSRLQIVDADENQPEAGEDGSE